MNKPAAIKATKSTMIVALALLAFFLLYQLVTWLSLQPWGSTAIVAGSVVVTLIGVWVAKYNALTG